jgi:gamma-glutamyltranspeptidase/glutathione hydrolase
MGHRLADPQPVGHAAGILVGAPVLGGKPRGNERFYGANDPRRGTGLASGY